MKTEILYGINPVFEALKAGKRRIYEIYIEESKISKRVIKVLKFAESKKIPVKKVKTPQLNSIVGNRQHQGVSAKVKPYEMADLTDIILTKPLNGNRHFIILLDHVIDPRNLGAIIRTALGVGVDAIIIPKDRSALPTPAVSKTSAGAIEHVRLIRVTNMVDTIMFLKQHGLWIVGLDRGADKTIYAIDLTGSIAIVIGGEEKGIRPLVKKKCDFIASIPQKGQVDSLNASVAAAIVMYEAFRQSEIAQN
jgi:23S rRNA (guanosine2251-2'-O)-methyltransferase